MDGGPARAAPVTAVNYNNVRFWLLFGIVYLVYWRVRRSRQNALLLGASYVFYGAWDYRFLFLILLSTIIDFIGGLGVAGVELAPAKRRWLGLLLVAAALLLTSGIDYGGLVAAIGAGRGADAWAALPHGWRGFGIPVAVVCSVLAYGAFLPMLYALPSQRRRKTFLTLSMVANLGILGFFKYCDFFSAGLVRLCGAIGFHPSWTTLNRCSPPGSASTRSRR